jgi:toxin ParE1/3/4
VNSRIARTPQARTELIAIHDYIDNDNPSVADRFLDAAEDCFEMLADLPEAGRAWPSDRHPTVRSHAIPGFLKYRVFYQPTNRGILILTVLHAARDLDKIFDEFLSAARSST